MEALVRKNYAAGRLSYTTDYASAYKDADAIFIGVGTPAQPDGSADLSFIATVARQIAETVEHDCLVVVKSTVPVGLRPVHVEVASNPEFLAQGTGVHDFVSWLVRI